MLEIGKIKNQSWLGRVLEIQSKPIPYSKIQILKEGVLKLYETQLFDSMLKYKLKHSFGVQ